MKDTVELIDEVITARFGDEMFSHTDWNGYEVFFTSDTDGREISVNEKTFELTEY